ncbi:leucine--tRNA ligase, partial [Candidatus Parcubacteria bacterium]|nr:leucine--tRNA ligase [Candidatus Parcubacteria bacterium]
GKIDGKWQSSWEKNQIHKASNTSKKPKKYVLSMFPYPSGAGLHVGHPRGYIAADVYARLKRMQGFNVLHPMGYDAFGLPAEQYAITHGVHPKDSTAKNIKTYQKQLEIIGLSYDWSRKINTTDEGYYKWTQWIFLKLYNHYYDHKAKKAKPISEIEGKFANLSQRERDKELMKYRLAYEGFSEVNWCEELGTVLANDEVIDGKSERGGYPVVKKMMRQWFLRITDYADRLISGLDTVDFDESLKTVQKNWIGKSVGVNFHCVIKDLNTPVSMYNSVPQTYHAETFTVIAPEHQLVYELVKGTEHEKSVMEFVDKIKKKKFNNKFDIENEMEGIFTGRYIKSFADTGKDLPIWVASYVVADYGTGIVNASVHDERDFAFAKKYGISLDVTMVPADPVEAQKVRNLEYAYIKDPKAILLKPAQFKGRLWGEAREDIIEHLVANKFATRQVNYKIRDAVFARQRYWGEPIPLKHDKYGHIIELKEKELPLKLPKVSSYEPIGSGESPLAGIASWVKAGYETNTMPGWAGSSWYFLRYMDAHNKAAPVGKKAIDYWQQVDMYVGGREHTTGHLLYSRFWHKFLYDIGLTVTEEPFKALRNQGMILGDDNQKMSKRWGNVVNPDDCINTYGADAFRMYSMFLGPFDSQLPWSTDGIIGTRRFVDRLWRLSQIVEEQNKKNKNIKTDIRLISKIHKTIKKVTDDIDGFAFNTAVSALMILLNEFEKAGEINQLDFFDFIKLLSPFAPHIGDEIWSQFKNKNSINIAAWPIYDESKIVEDTITVGIQINGKLRGDIEIVDTKSEAEILEEAKYIVKHHLEGKVIKKTIYIKGKIISFVI